MRYHHVAAVKKILVGLYRRFCTDVQGKPPASLCDNAIEAYSGGCHPGPLRSGFAALLAVGCIIS